MDLTKLDNPYIRVEWEDTPENFSQEKIKRIKAYFCEKYNTKHVQVKTITTIKEQGSNTMKTLELSDNILDTQYQKKMIKEFMQNNNMTVPWDMITRLDDKVNGEIDKAKQNHLRHNKWSIKKIEFSNFLSYGENNVLDFSTLGGITAVESDPPNFGGKTVLSVDLLLFLFFNTTSRSKTAAQVFNLYSDANEVVVRGYLEIDGMEYIIERIVTRKRKKNGEWNVETDLNFGKKDASGEYHNEEGEQRNETEKFIQNAIGDKEDFLATILTTGNNLEELLEAKATARGQLLTKLIGLESIKEKEEICKKMHTEWSKKLISNQYNITTLEADTEKRKEWIKNSKDLSAGSEKDLKVVAAELQSLKQQKESLLLRQHTDIDQVLAKVNPTMLQQEIANLRTNITTRKEQLLSIVVTEPSEYYHEEQHTEAQKNLNNQTVQLRVKEQEVRDLTHQITQLTEGKICPTCKRELDKVDHSEEIAALNSRLELTNGLISDIQAEKVRLEAQVEKFKQLKREFDEYDRQKLIQAKAEVELQQKELELHQKRTRFAEWEKNRQKLEDNLNIERQMVEVRTKIETKEAEVRILETAIRDYATAIENHEATIKNNGELISKIKKEEDVQKVFQGYLTIFGKNGISKSILRSMIPLMNRELARILADSCHFTLEVRINEKHEVEFIMVDNESRVENHMASGSGYEKTVASLALRAVLSKVSSLPKPNVVVMDEVFGKIAKENLDMVGEFFIKIKSYFEHILLIVHDPLVKNWADNVIMIRKEGNISKIEG